MSTAYQRRSAAGGLPGPGHDLLRGPRRRGRTSNTHPVWRSAWPLSPVPPLPKSEAARGLARGGGPGSIATPLQSAEITSGRPGPSPPWPWSRARAG